MDRDMLVRYLDYLAHCGGPFDDPGDRYRRFPDTPQSTSPFTDDTEPWVLPFGEAADALRLMREALQAVEWVHDRLDQPDYCPWCVACETDGHKPDCLRQLALGLTK